MDSTEFARFCVSPRVAVANAGTALPASVSDALLGNLGSVTISLAGLATPVYFNARGLPCHFNTANGTCSATISSGTSATSWVYYLYNNPYVGAANWAAVTVTPAGRVRVWSWNGAAWK